MINRFCLKLVLVGLLASLSIRLAAEDWPQYRGPKGDGLVSEKLGLKPWPAGGLKTVWKVPAATGFSCFSVADEKVFTLVKRNVEGADREVCVALNADTGKELWAVPFSNARYDGGGDSGGGGDGPRSTPAWNDGRVYVLDSRLVIGCMDAASGRVVWKKDLVKENGGKVIQWQGAASPLVDGNLVFVAAGGAGQSLLGLDKKTGQVVWKAESDPITHATPVAATILDARQIIFFTQKGLVAVAPKSGKVLWRYNFPYSVSTAASPVVCGDMVYCSAGYGVGAGLCRITPQWRRPGGHRGLAQAQQARESLEHSGVQGRLPLRHVQLQGIRPGPPQVR